MATRSKQIVHGRAHLQVNLIRLDQGDVDALTAHTEPDEILSALIQSGDIDGELSYLERLDDFIPRYRQAVQWGLSNRPTDFFIASTPTCMESGSTSTGLSMIVFPLARKVASRSPPS